MIASAPGSHIHIGGIPISQISDDDLVAYFNRKKAATGRRPIRKDTARLWIEIVRSFDICDTPMTVRQMFYQCSVKGVVEKTEPGYKQIANHLGIMRKEGVIPYHFIADLTRWLRKPPSYASLESALEETRRHYRRSLWANQPEHVEIWIEKDALIGTIWPVTEEYDVPIFPGKGRPSLSFLHGAAESIKSSDKWTYIYYFGDWDPTGVNIPKTIDKTLVEMGAETYTFEVVALTPEQIETWNLPTRPTKRNHHDHLAKRWKGDSAELDAIPPQKLRELVRECIERHIDPDLLARTKRIEELERATLNRLVLQVGTSPKYGEVGA